MLSVPKFKYPARIEKYTPGIHKIFQRCVGPLVLIVIVTVMTEALCSGDRYGWGESFQSSVQNPAPALLAVRL